MREYRFSLTHIFPYKDKIREPVFSHNLRSVKDLKTSLKCYKRICFIQRKAFFLSYFKNLERKVHNLLLDKNGDLIQ